MPFSDYQNCLNDFPKTYQQVYCNILLCQAFLAGGA